MLTDAAIILFAIFLYIVCAVLMVMEIFIPSFGLLSLLALGAFCGERFYFFRSVRQSAGRPLNGDSGDTDVLDYYL